MIPPVEVAPQELPAMIADVISCANLAFTISFLLSRSHPRRCYDSRATLLKQQLCFQVVCQFNDKNGDSVVDSQRLQSVHHSKDKNSDSVEDAQRLQSVCNTAGEFDYGSFDQAHTPVDDAMRNQDMFTFSEYGAGVQ